MKEKPFACRLCVGVDRPEGPPRFRFRSVYAKHLRLAHPEVSPADPGLYPPGAPGMGRDGGTGGRDEDLPRFTR